MSLIVGIRCVDSVVLAASGPSVGPSSDGLPPARQWARRLRVVAGQAVLGAAAHDGLAQEMALSLENCLARPDQRAASDEVLRHKLREALAAPIQRSVAIHRTLQGLPGFGITSNEYVLSQTLLAIPLGNRLRLFVLDPECSLTEVAGDLTEAAVGRARVLAEPFLAFLRDMLWPSGMPSLAQGELAAYWTVLHTIQRTAAGLTLPIQLVSIRRAEDGSIEIVERGERELGTLLHIVREREDEIRRALEGLGAGAMEDGAPRGRASEEESVRKRVPEVRLKLESPGRERGPFRK